ncbi:MAG: Smr/MutS family protein [Pseudomonadota bacterium]
MAPKPIEPFHIGEKKTETVVPKFPKADMPAVKMDKKAFGQLKRGKLKPEARIDLHGMTLAQAQPRLFQFIRDTHAKGMRLVLVITGKGKDRDDGGPIPTPRGVLRRQVPIWLGHPPLSAMVLQVAEAHLKHGGEGAFYVYLRRRK